MHTHTHTLVPIPSVFLVATTTTTISVDVCVCGGGGGTTHTLIIKFVQLFFRPKGENIRTSQLEAIGSSQHAVHNQSNPITHAFSLSLLPQLILFN